MRQPHSTKLASLSHAPLLHFGLLFIDLGMIDDKHDNDLLYCMKQVEAMMPKAEDLVQSLRS